jgi:signal peptidase I
MGDMTQAHFYSGHSMAGTFLSADWLTFAVIPFTSIQRGDVLVFHNEAEKLIVHRVVRQTQEGIVTQGDNSLEPDPEFLTPEHVVSQVIHRERNGKTYNVQNGRLGMLRARVLHGRLHFIKALKFFLKRPYRILKKTGIVTKLWRPEIETIHFETQDGPLVKYVHKGRTVASCWTDTNRWWFRRPYDFIIDPKAKAKGKR